MSDRSLDDKVAIVTGAGNGIARAIALTFAHAGAAVACVDSDAAAANATAAAIAGSGRKVIAVGCDVSVEADTLRAAAAARDAFGVVHVLVNAAAGYDAGGTVCDIAPDEWDRVFAVHVRGAYLMSRAVLPLMVAAGEGSIIHMGSQLGRVGTAERPAYCAAKAALIQLAKAMAIDHAGQNIRVNAISPGAIETQRMTRRFGTMEEARRVMGPKHLMGRLGQPQEIAEAALFLASDASSFMTGADLLVDGGYAAI
jgi:NAD(P)-dependent dehydrogenase (short-subunit alcohol dehydrogenase family)